MAVMYFAKVSMSSEIYDLYEHPEQYPEFLNKLYGAINPNLTIIDENKTKYKFNSLMYDNNKKAIAGRYSKIYHGEVESYDFIKDEPMSEHKPNLSATVNFYFDVEEEIIAYTAARDFGYKAFTEMFKQYIETALADEKIKVAVELLINDKELIEQIENLKVVEELTFSIIPPNPPNRKQFDDLFGSRANVIYESGTTQYKEVYETKSKKTGHGIKMTDYFRNIITAIKDGYGKVRAEGINYGGHNETITSSDNAPRKYTVDTELKDSIPYIKEQGEKGIRNILIEKNKLD